MTPSHFSPSLILQISLVTRGSSYAQGSLEVLLFTCLVGCLVWFGFLFGVFVFCLFGRLYLRLNLGAHAS